MKYGKLVGIALMASLMFGSIAACQKPAGPAERAGKELDKAVDKAGQQIEKAGDSLQDAAKREKQ